tara:strand:- start:3354 stop:4922 length:1569 start_codon:yes stop_codon:yes gene_type:complete
MTFAFPANPADGDIVVQPQPDGSFLKGTYNSITNTWALGEIVDQPGVPGPRGPRGEQGEPGPQGVGVQIAGSVASADDLPAANNFYNKYYVVTDSNSLYFSNGFEWFDEGSPIQGPQGETGEDGTDGVNGSNGAPGKGWTGTTIIDETDQDPANYQVRFNSNDGLGFITTNLMGEKGDPGELEVASATNIGGIKIGRGLNILPDGTANAGETNVDLETTPLEPNGYALPYRPIYNQFVIDNQVTDGNTKTLNAYGPTAVANWATTLPGNISMPTNCTQALVWWTVPSSFTLEYADSLNIYTNGQSLNFRCYLLHKLTLGDNVEFVGRGVDNSSNPNVTNKAINHNFTPLYVKKSDGTSSLTNRATTLSFNKIELITFPKNTVLQPNITTDVISMSTGTITIGGLRAIILPMRSEQATENFLAAQFFDVETEATAPVLTGPEIIAEQAADLRERTIVAITVINTIIDIPSATQAEITQLETLRTNILGIIDLPGTYEDLSQTLSGYVDELNTSFLENTYRFEL